MEICEIDDVVKHVTANRGREIIHITKLLARNGPYVYANEFPHMTQLYMQIGKHANRRGLHANVRFLYGNDTLGFYANVQYMQISQRPYAN